MIPKEVEDLKNCIETVIKSSSNLNHVIVNFMVVLTIEGKYHAGIITNVQQLRLMTEEPKKFLEAAASEMNVDLSKVESVTMIHFGKNIISMDVTKFKESLKELGMSEEDIEDVVSGNGKIQDHLSIAEIKSLMDGGNGSVLITHGTPQGRNLYKYNVEEESFVSTKGEIQGSRRYYLEEDEEAKQGRITHHQHSKTGDKIKFDEVDVTSCLFQ